MFIRSGLRGPFPRVWVNHFALEGSRADAHGPKGGAHGVTRPTFGAPPPSKRLRCQRAAQEGQNHSLSDGAASGEATHAIGFAGEGAGPGNITMTGRITGIAAFGKNPT